MKNLLCVLALCAVGLICNVSQAQTKVEVQRKGLFGLRTEVKVTQAPAKKVVQQLVVPAPQLQVAQYAAPVRQVRQVRQVQQIQVAPVYQVQQVQHVVAPVKVQQIQLQPVEVQQYVAPQQLRRAQLNNHSDCADFFAG